MAEHLLYAVPQRAVNRPDSRALWQQCSLIFDRLTTAASAAARSAIKGKQTGQLITA